MSSKAQQMHETQLGGTMDLDPHLGSLGAEMERLGLAASEPVIEQTFHRNIASALERETRLDAA